jgi:hypothetical protein
MTKLVVLVVILAMIFGGIAASLVALFAGPGSVVGTYVASDGRKLVLDKKGMATISLPSGGQSGQAPYKVKGGSVVITASSGPGDHPEDRRAEPGCGQRGADGDLGPSIRVRACKIGVDLIGADVQCVLPFAHVEFPSLQLRHLSATISCSVVPDLSRVSPSCCTASVKSELNRK